MAQIWKQNLKCSYLVLSLPGYVVKLCFTCKLLFWISNQLSSRISGSNSTYGAAVSQLDIQKFLYELVTSTRSLVLFFF